jgi:hypothetical protein
MQDRITSMFHVCGDFLKTSGHCDDGPCRVSTTQVMITPLVAVTFFDDCLRLNSIV